MDRAQGERIRNEGRLLSVRETLANIEVRDVPAAPTTPTAGILALHLRVLREMILLDVAKLSCALPDPPPQRREREKALRFRANLSILSSFASFAPLREILFFFAQPQSSWRILILRNQIGCPSACKAMWPNESRSGAPEARRCCASLSVGSSCGCW